MVRKHLFFGLREATRKWREGPISQALETLDRHFREDGLGSANFWSTTNIWVQKPRKEHIFAKQKKVSSNFTAAVFFFQNKTILCFKKWHIKPSQKKNTSNNQTTFNTKLWFKRASNGFFSKLGAEEVGLCWIPWRLTSERLQRLLAYLGVCRPTEAMVAQMQREPHRGTCWVTQGLMGQEPKKTTDCL